MSSFQQIETAPYGRLVEVKIGRRWIAATLVRNGSMDESERDCDQWQAENEDYPPCWSDGCCWESNADGFASKQPEAWREIVRDSDGSGEADKTQSGLAGGDSAGLKGIARNPRRSLIKGHKQCRIS